MCDLLCLLILTFIINTKNFCDKKRTKNGNKNTEINPPTPATKLKPHINQMENDRFVSQDRMQ